VTEWVELAVVLAIHDRQIAEHGGLDGLRDEGLLKSALERPQHLVAYADPKPDFAALAAAYAFGIAKSQAFLDGNKRTSNVVSLTFLRQNGFTVNADQAEQVRIWSGLADGTVSETELPDWFRFCLVKTC
jgi:death on curing protein